MQDLETLLVNNPAIRKLNGESWGNYDEVGDLETLVKAARELSKPAEIEAPKGKLTESYPPDNGKVLVHFVGQSRCCPTNAAAAISFTSDESSEPIIALVPLHRHIAQRLILQSRLAQINAVLCDRPEEMLAQQEPDPIDQSAALSAQAECLRRQTQLTEERAEIEYVLALLESGYDGACSECKHEIPITRVLAAPHSTRCTDCQAEFEKQKAGEMGGELTLSFAPA